MIMAGRARGEHARTVRRVVGCRRRLIRDESHVHAIAGAHRLRRVPMRERTLRDKQCKGQTDEHSPQWGHHTKCEAESAGKAIMREL
jgi:hypothetical protein